MSSEVVIVGGGFGGLYAARRLERFGRASAELGQLGHPAALREPRGGS